MVQDATIGCVLIPIRIIKGHDRDEERHCPPKREIRGPVKSFERQLKRFFVSRASIGIIRVGTEEFNC